MKIYQIDDQIEKLFNDAEVDKKTGEIIVDIDKLDDLKMEKTKKIEYLVKMYINTGGDIEKFKAEETSLAKKRKTIENKAASLKSYLDTLHNGCNAEYGVHTVRYTKSTQLNGDDISLLPVEYVNVTKSADKNEIKKYLKKGKIEGWTLVDKKNIQIK